LHKALKIIKIGIDLRFKATAVQNANVMNFCTWNKIDVGREFIWLVTEKYPSWRDLRI